MPCRTSSVWFRFQIICRGHPPSCRLVNVSSADSRMLFGFETMHVRMWEQAVVASPRSHVCSGACGVGTGWPWSYCCWAPMGDQWILCSGGRQLSVCHPVGDPSEPDPSSAWRHRGFWQIACYDTAAHRCDGSSRAGWWVLLIKSQGRRERRGASSTTHFIQKMVGRLSDSLLSSWKEGHQKKSWQLRYWIWQGVKSAVCFWLHHHGEPASISIIAAILASQTLASAAAPKEPASGVVAWRLTVCLSGP